MTKIVALEGIDASGKTMQHSLLRDRLKSLGYSVAEKSFPEYSRFFGAQISELLNGKSLRADAVDAKSMCLWFAMDRWLSFQDTSWKKSDFLLINRYVLSNAVYQSIREIDSGDMLEWVLELEHVQLALPEPDVYIFMDVPPQLSDRNMASRAQRGYTSLSRDVYEQSEGIQARARAKYIEYALRMPNIMSIEVSDGSGMLHFHKIHDMIFNGLKNRGLV